VLRDAPVYSVKSIFRSNLTVFPLSPLSLRNSCPRCVPGVAAIGVSRLNLIVRSAVAGFTGEETA